MRELQGAIIIGSAFQAFLGYSGLMSLILRSYISCLCPKLTPSINIKIKHQLLVPYMVFCSHMVLVAYCDAVFSYNTISFDPSSI